MSAATRIVEKETQLRNIQKIYDTQKEDGNLTIRLNIVDFDHLLKRAANAIAYEKTLDFYASENNYVYDENGFAVGIAESSLIMSDFGERAQDTLEENY